MALNVISFPGSQPTIVLLHGLGGTARYWTSVKDFSSTDNEVSLVDLLGFGDSPKPYCRYTIGKHLQALIPELEKFDDIILIGHSLGAALALAYAARYPQRIKRLVLISLPYFGNMQTVNRWFRHKPGGWIYTNIFATGLACIFTRHIAARILPYLIKSYPKVVIQDLVKHNVMSSTTSLWNILYTHDLETDCERLPSDLAVTCIHSDDDDSAPINGVEHLANRYHWTLHRLNGTGHHPWLRNPKKCWTIIRDTSKC